MWLFCFLSEQKQEYMLYVIEGFIRIISGDGGKRMYLH